MYLPTKKFLILSLFGLFCSAQTLHMLTGGSSNGRFWVESDSSAKIGYLRGFMDSLVLLQTFPGAKASPVPLFPRTMTIVEVAEALDQFYKEPTNRVIPVFAALNWVTKKSDGASKESLEKLQSGLRANWSPK